MSSSGILLVAGGDQRRQLFADPERGLVALDPLDGVALVDGIPGQRGGGHADRGYAALLHLGKWVVRLEPQW